MFEADSQDVGRVNIGFLLGTSVSSARLAALLAAPSVQDDVKDGILDALRRITLKEEHVNNLQLVLGSAGHGIAVTFEVSAAADDLPPASHIVTALLQKKVIFVSGTALTISNADTVTGCLVGTVPGPEGTCVTEVVTTTGAPATTRGGVDCGSFGCCADGKTPKGSSDDACKGKTNSSKGSGVSHGGVVAGVVVIVLLAVGVGLFIYRKRFLGKIKYTQLEAIHDVAHDSDEGGEGGAGGGGEGDEDEGVRLQSKQSKVEVASERNALPAVSFANMQSFADMQRREDEEDDAMIDYTGDVATFTPNHN